MISLDWRSAALACTADPYWRKRIWQGGLYLMIPFVGWPMVLGYRRLFAERLIDGNRPLLPAWRGRRVIALRHGLAAMAVIHSYYAPLYLWLGMRMGQWNLWSELPWLPILVFLAAFSIFSTLTLPVWILWLRWGSSTDVAPLELVILGVLFAGITFAIPAGFLRVSRTGRTISAFHLPANLCLIRSAPVRYVEAWLGSGVMSLAAHFCLPLAPWGVFWCYLGIIYCFNEVPVTGGADYLRSSWFDYFRRQHWGHYAIHRRFLVETLELQSDGPLPLGRPEGRIRAMCVGPVRLPLPPSGARGEDLGYHGSQEQQSQPPT